MKYLKSKKDYANNYLAMPFILSLTIPLIVSDIWIEVFHRVAFPLYGIPFVKRSSYIKFDRQKLKYLTPKQKVYCVYCGYANGALQYWVKIIGETEAYWCGIQHKKDPNFVSPRHHKKFTRYDDSKDFENKYLK